MNAKRLLLSLFLVITLSSPALAKDKKNERVKKILKTRKVTLNFSDTPMPDVVRFLTDITGLYFVLDSGAKVGNKGISIKQRDVSLINALKLALSVNKDCAYKVEHGLVIVTTKKRLKLFQVAKAPKASTAEQTKKWAALEKKTLTLTFAETPLSDVLRFLKDISGESMKLKSAKLGKSKVTLYAKKMSLIDAVTYIAQANGMELVWSGNSLMFKAK